MPVNQKRPWFYSSWLIIPLMFFCFPIGIALMWAGKRYTWWLRSIISGAWAFLWVAAIISSSIKNQSNTPTLNQVMLADQKAKAIQAPKILNHEEKIKKLTECNAQYIDPKIVEKQDSSAVEESKKVTNNDGTVEQESKEDLIKNVEQFDPECLRLYGEVYDRNRTNWRKAEKQATLKFPNALSAPNLLKESSSYEEKLSEQYERQLLKEYQITKQQFWTINEVMSPIKERDQNIEAENLKTKFTKDSLFGERIIKLEVLPQVDASHVVRVLFKASDWSAEAAREEIIADTMRFAEQVFTSPEYKNVMRVEIRPYASMIDKYGNTSVDEVGWLSVDRNLAEKINWKNITPDMFEKLLSESEGGIWLHRAFNEQ